MTAMVNLSDQLDVSVPSFRLNQRKRSMDYEAKVKISINVVKVVSGKVRD
jgi:hypothetical protein